MADMIERKLCKSDEFANDSMKEIEIDLGLDAGGGGDPKTAKVLLIKQHNKFFCLATKCSHYSVPLVNGVVYKNRLRCFAHGACFDIRTGDIEDYPGVDCLPKYEVFIDRDRDVYLRASRTELLTNKRVKGEAECKSRPLSAAEHRPCSVNIRGNDRLSATMKQIKSRCLIIGSGAAGLLALETLREAGYGSNITMITRDEFLPYDRPKLSKALDSNINAIKLRDEAFINANHVNFFPDQEVENFDFDKRQVFTTSGRTFDYDRLIIATGLKPIQPFKYNDLRGVFTLRTMTDANRIHAYFAELNKNIQPPQSRRLNVILIGSSFISMEVAGYFGDKANVAVMSLLAPFEQTLGMEVSRKIQKLHESKGVKFLVDSKFNIEEFVESKERRGCLEAIRVNDGTVWPVDILIVGIGGRPVTELVKNTQINLSPQGFIYVDAHMRTNVPNVYAAGDITFFPRSCLVGLDSTTTTTTKPTNHVNIAHWGVASSQGRVAAEAIIESDNGSSSNPFKVVPFFWTSQFGKNIRFAGLNDKYDEIVFHEDKTKANEFKFAAFYLNGGKCVAVGTLDWDPVCAVFAEALYNGIEVKKEHIEANPLDIKKLLV